jgi:uncharacterized protein
MVLQSRKNKGFQLLNEIIWLTILTLGAMLLFSVIGLRLTSALYHIDYFTLMSGNYSDATTQVISALKFLNLFTTLGTFLVPVIGIPLINKEKPLEFLMLDKSPGLMTILQATALFLLLFPFLEWLINFNQGIHLPVAFGQAEEWIRAKEAQMEQLTEQFLTMVSLRDMFLNLLIVAFIPAMLEELYFRGLVQKLAHKWFGNIHFAIIFTAIFFSAVHLQFLGFLPRFLLGFLFGYLFYWTGSIWTTVFAHFLNNGLAVILLYLGQKGIINYQMDQPMNSSNTTIIFSFAVAALFFLALAFYYNRKRDKTKDWVMVCTSFTVAEAEIVKGNLENEGIIAVVVNKKDSSYLSFGAVEVYVKPEDEERAKEIISHENIPLESENDTEEETEKI